MVGWCRHSFICGGFNTLPDTVDLETREAEVLATKGQEVGQDNIGKRSHQCSDCLKEETLDYQFHKCSVCTLARYCWTKSQREHRGTLKALCRTIKNLPKNDNFGMLYSFDKYLFASQHPMFNAQSDEPIGQTGWRQMLSFMWTWWSGNQSTVGYSCTDINNASQFFISYWKSVQIWNFRRLMVQL